MVEAFSLVLYGAETTFVSDLKSCNLYLDVFVRSTNLIQSSTARINPTISQASPNHSLLDPPKDKTLWLRI
ncbi:hypothetical protein DSO57_1003865 [Entomophthora muscae]|uniref:Uncharacterized protein n=1 Tax=Entomophthora muscae TaxID=34485 RepID=A0ACC2RN68_9FUNG|nr:hypothetical protein DSO57_1003865 [Entomophthora muscae]